MKTLILAALFLPVAIQAQEKKWHYEQPKIKEYAPSAVLTLFAGASTGFRDAMLFYKIKNGSFWDGRESWKNKYRNGDYKQGPAYLGSTSILAFTTDGVHFMPVLTNQFDDWSAVLLPVDNNRRFGHLLLKVAAMTVVRSVGHALVYEGLFKNNNR